MIHNDEHDRPSRTPASSPPRPPVFLPAQSERESLVDGGGVALAVFVVGFIAVMLLAWAFGAPLLRS
jgi:hypothetical protein